MNIDKLKRYGFREENKVYTLRKKLNNHLIVVLQLINHDLKEKVIDENTQEEYLLYQVNHGGAFVQKLQDEINDLKEDIKKNCFNRVNVKDKVIQYIKEHYQINPEYPWKDTPLFCTFKNKGKWFGIIMNISYQKLRPEKNGLVDLINVKLPKEIIPTIVDYKNVFPAYHMNKVYWVSILLDEQIEFSKITKFIDQSYKIVS